MTSLLMFYAKLLGLLVVLLAVVGFNVAVWGLHRHPTQPALYVPGGKPERGRLLIQEFGCGSCHVVPGVYGATGNAGPPLDRVRERVYVAGVVPNTASNLTFWIADPKEVDSRTAMPDLGVTELEARDIAAYLYDLP